MCGHITHCYCLFIHSGQEQLPFSDVNILHTLCMSCLYLSFSHIIGTLSLWSHIVFTIKAQSFLIITRYDRDRRALQGWREGTTLGVFRWYCVTSLHSSFGYTHACIHHQQDSCEWTSLLFLQSTESIIGQSMKNWGKMRWGGAGRWGRDDERVVDMLMAVVYKLRGDILMGLLAELSHSLTQY